MLDGSISYYIPGVLGMADTRVLMLETPIFSHYVSNSAHRTTCGVDIIGIAKDADEALKVTHFHAPDVILVDLQKESQDGYVSLVKLGKVYPRAWIIGRVKNLDKTKLLDAIEAGVMGFVSDQTCFYELIEAIQTVTQGNAFFPQAVLRQFVQGLQHQTSASQILH